MSRSELCYFEAGVDLFFFHYNRTVEHLRVKVREADFN